MSSAAITLKGTIEIGGDCCGGVSACGTGPGKDVQPIGLRCGSTQYQGAVQTPIPLRIQTPGNLGQNFVDLDVLGDLVQIELLYMKSDQPMVVRLNAAAARVTGVAGVFPTLFVGGETLTFALDGVPVAVAFLAGDQSAAQCAARINAACALAGLPTPRASVASSGQLQIEGILTGAQPFPGSGGVTGSIQITGGTGAAQLGLAGLTAIGAGSDVDFFGMLLKEGRPSPNGITRVQVSGVGSLYLIAAGRTSST